MSTTFLLLLVPLLIGAAIAIFNSPTANDPLENVAEWVRNKYSSVSTQSGVLSEYVATPTLGGLNKVVDWTSGITHPGLRSGTRVAGTLYAFLGLLFLAYVVVSLIIVYYVFKAIGAVLGEASDSDDYEEEEYSARVITPRSAGAYSERKERLLGGEYIQYYDEDGHPVGTAEIKERLFGGEYVQYYDADGNEVGNSELKESLLGDDYVQHYDDSGDRDGTSVEKERLLGGEFTQHYDKEGDKSGTSEEKERVLGGKYVEHRPE